MCSGSATPGNSTSGSGKIGSLREVTNVRYISEQASDRWGLMREGRRPSGRRPSDQLKLPARIRSSCLPESGEGPAVGRVAKLLERPLPDLSNPLPCDSHEKADLLERHRLAAFVETIVQGEDLPLT